MDWQKGRKGRTEEYCAHKKFHQYVLYKISDILSHESNILEVSSFWPLCVPFMFDAFW